MKIKLMVSLLLVLAMPFAWGQSDVYVSDASGSDVLTCGSLGSPCQTIQYAVDSIAMDGDTVRIDTGEYSIATSVSSNTPVVKLPQGKSLSFIGSTSGQGTRIHGDSLRRGFLYYYSGTGCNTGSANDGIDDTLTFFFRDLIIEDCRITEMCGSTSYAYGGGMRLDCDTGSALNVFISHCIFRRNQAYDSPGTFAGGRSASGGAVFIFGRRSGTSNLGTFAQAHISYCDFNQNSANQNWNGGHGGAVLLRDLDTASVTHSSFCDNFCYSQAADNGDLQHDRNAGGAICVYDLNNTTPGHNYEVDLCTFIDNSATTNGGANFTFNSEGGAIFLTKGDVLTAQNTATLKISNSEFYNNYIEVGVEHIDKNGGTIDTTSIGFNAYYDQFDVGLGNDTMICDGDSLVLDAQMPGGIYLWQDGSTGPTFTVNDSGLYSVTVTVGSCEVLDTIEVGVQTYPSVYLGEDTTLCPYDSINLDVFVQNALYTWSTGDSTSSIQYSDSGQVWVEVSVSGCAASDTIEIDTVQLSQNLLLPDTILCPAATMNLSAAVSGASSYLWQNGSVSSSVLVTSAGLYAVTVTKEGCTVSDTTDVTYVAQINDIIGGDQVACDEDTIVLQVMQSNLEAITWSNGSIDSVRKITVPGVYGVTINDRGCLFSDSIAATFKPLPEVDLGNDTSACDGTVIWMNVYNDGATYLWSYNNYSSPFFPIAVSGTYTVTVTLDGCSASDEITVDIHPVPELELVNDVSFCEGDSAEVHAKAPSNADYIWSTGQSTDRIMVDRSGIYSVTVSKDGCSATDSVLVAVYPVPVIDLGPDLSVCAGNTTVLSPGGSAMLFEWQDGSTDSTFLAQAPGLYWVIASNGLCGAMDSLRYETRPLPSLKAINDTIICFGDSFSFVQKDTATTFTWNNSQNGLKFQVSEEGLYTVIGSNDCGIRKDTAFVSIRECECRMYIPNAFSPYRDLMNDVFKVEHICNLERFNISIYDRWGNQIFYSEDDAFEWDGMYKGKQVPLGVYAYIIEYRAYIGLKAKKPTTFTETGMINLLR